MKLPSSLLHAMSLGISVTTCVALAKSCNEQQAKSAKNPKNTIKSPFIEEKGPFDEFGRCPNCGMG